MVVITNLLMSLSVLAARQEFVNDNVLTDFFPFNYKLVSFCLFLAGERGVSLDTVTGIQLVLLNEFISNCVLDRASSAAEPLNSVGQLVELLVIILQRHSLQTD